MDVNEDGRIARSELAAFAGLDARFVEQLREMEETDPDPPTYDRDQVDRHRENDSSMHEYGGDIAEDVSAERAAEHETSLPSESGRDSRDGGGDRDFIDDDDDDDNSRSFDNDYLRRRESEPIGRGGGGSVRGGGRGGRNSNSNPGGDGGAETTGHGSYRPGSAREAHHGGAYDNDDDEDEDDNNRRSGGGGVPPAAAASVYSAPPINRRRPTSAVADRQGRSVFYSHHTFQRASTLPVVSLITNEHRHFFPSVSLESRKYAWE